MSTSNTRGARTYVILAVLALVMWPGAVRAQEPTDSLRAELERLRARVDSLMVVVERLRNAGEDTTGVANDLAAVRAAAAAAANRGGARDTAAAEPTTQFVGRQRNQQALNPEITLTGDLFGFVDMDDPDERNFVPREVELSIQSALDPYALAKVFVGFHDPGGELEPFGDAHEHHELEDPGDADIDEEASGHGGEVAVEEAYIQWRGLLGGLNVSAGRFRQNFGTLNRWHPHALPAQTYPLPYLAFFGEEGLAQTGVSVHWLSPFAGFGTWEAWAEVTTSSNEVLFGEASTPSLLGRINAFWELSPATYFEVGANALTGPGQGGDDSFGTHVFGGDFTLSWRPPARSRYREANLRGGVVAGELAPELEPVLAEPGTALGGFLIGEYRLDQRWILGARSEYMQNPLDPDESTWLAAPTITWWQSEWVRLRAEFDYLARPDDTLRLLVLQATFAMGPHKHETY